MSRQNLLDLTLTLQQTISNITAQNYEEHFYLSIAARNLRIMREELLENLENNTEPTAQRITEITNTHAVVVRSFVNLMHFHNLIHQPHPLDSPLRNENNTQQENDFSFEVPDLSGDLSIHDYMLAFGCIGGKA